MGIDTPHRNCEAVGNNELKGLIKNSLKIGPGS
jgi:hypothetical protein